jgi:hypothetical protein
VAFHPFGWLLTFAKAKAGWKAQPKGPNFTSKVLTSVVTKDKLKPQTFYLHYPSSPL